MLKPTFEEFKELAKQGNVVPVYRELLADMETPVSVFKKLDAISDHAFLLESVEQGEQLGRFSFLGCDPAVILRVRGEEQEIVAERERLMPRETPVETMRYLLSRYQPVLNPDLPPFFGGAVGYMAYDTVRYYENIPDSCPDDLQLPDCVIMIAESLIAFDHVKHRMILIVNAHVDADANLEEAYTRAVMKLGYLKGQLGVRLPVDTLSEHPRLATRTKNGKPSKATQAHLDRESDEGQEQARRSQETFGVSVPVESNFEKEEFKSIVEKAKEYIAAGDIFQVVLSQRFAAKINCPPFDVYRALRAVNPSPYMFYLKCGPDLQVAGSSPEILCKLQNDRVTVRPIAGTRPRGETHTRDIELENELLADEKERAEHVMLVDLGRNDIGRVCRYQTVEVDDFMVIERYSHVMHIVSNVTGELREGKDAFDVIGATFPAGTLSGAPKIRAMEIIDELEHNRRGPYGGAVVYLSFDGNMDSCITIRTAVIKEDTVFVQAGAGIVADSVPESEYQECVNKARGMLKAVDMAEQGLE